MKFESKYSSFIFLLEKISFCLASIIMVYLVALMMLSKTKPSLEFTSICTIMAGLLLGLNIFLERRVNSTDDFRK